MKSLFAEIFEIDFPILEIGDRRGLSYYIDFIMPEELLDQNIMKGQDAFGRRFIVFKAEVKINGEKIVYSPFISNDIQKTQFCIIQPVIMEHTCLTL
jgi:hypothetical protein